MRRRFIQKAVCITAACAMFITGINCDSTLSQAASKPEKIIMNRKQVKLKVGKTFKLKVKSVKPVKAGKAVTYKINKKKIAAVSRKGIIKGKKAGKAVITVTSKINKKVKVKVKVTVTKANTTDKAAATDKSNTTAPIVTIQGTKATTAPVISVPDVNATAVPVVPTQTPVTEPINIYSAGGIAPVIMDMSYEGNEYSERTYEQVSRAVADLRQDIAMVTGAIDYKEIQQIFCDSEQAEVTRIEEAKITEADKVPELVTDISDIDAATAIIIGTIGESNIIDSLISEGKLDEAKNITGVWEGYVIKQVSNPVKGVDNALVIAGSDARGTIYGVYTISEKIGVSPFYWYSDVPVATKDSIDVDTGNAIVDDGPDVKYRGIFINDEEKSNIWAEKKFTEDGTNGPGVNYYRKVFELLLRMKANTLWPAMHACSVAFNKVVDENGLSVNGKEAAEYGIIMGASHCEILLRNNVGEWGDWFNANKGRFSDVKHSDDSYKAYDFTLNREMLVQYWRERLEANMGFESILTVGVRGPHDEAFNCENINDYEGSSVNEKKVNFMQDVISCQRDLIAEIYGEENVQKIPQVLIPYKEMNDVYNAGLNKFMLWDGSEDFNGDGEVNWKDDNSDIMLMWAEDNENYLRQDLTDAEAARKGGAGIYYHISYWGPPSSFLWLNSTSLYTMSEQMHRGYNIGANDYWILNVGDIKPSEPSMEFFMKMGWSPEKWDDTTVGEYLKEQALRDYGLSEEDAGEMSDAISEYFIINGIRKAEFYAKGDYGTAFTQFSTVANGDEAMLWVNRSNALVEKVKALNDKLSDEYKDAFYEQFYYNVLSLNDIIENFMYYQKNQTAASQGRVGSANVYADLSKQASARIKARLTEYNSTNNDKWTGFMDCKHPGRNYVLVGDGGETYKSVTNATDGVGAACENSMAAGSGTLRFDSHIKDETRYIDVFDKNVIKEKWVAEADKDWIKLSVNKGETLTEQRIQVTIDWTKVTSEMMGSISVYNADDSGVKTGSAVATFSVEADNTNTEYGENKGYIEADGYVAIEAEHYSDMIKGEDGSYWGVIKSNGQNGDTVKALDDSAHPTTDWDNTGKLVYKVYFKNAGTYELSLKKQPILNEGSEDGVDRSMNVALGIGNETPQVLKGSRMSGNWQMNLNMCEKLKCNITVDAGWNDIVVYRSDASFVWDRMEIETVKGALCDSNLGPDESPNNIAEAGIYRVAVMAKELAEYSPAKEIILSSLNNVSMNVNDSKTIDLTAYATNNSQVTVTAVSDDSTAVTTALKDNKLTVTSNTTTGNVMITVKATAKDCADVTKQFRVTVRDTSVGGLYSEAGGEVVINTSDALQESAYAWTEVTSPFVWNASGSGIAVAPDTGSKWDNTADLSKAPSVSFKVKIFKSGNYYLYSNMSNPNADADSYHVSIDGKYVYTHNSGELTGNMIWRSAGKAVNLTAGEHTITLSAREDGLVLNQICLTTNNAKAFTDGKLEAASAQESK